VTASHVFNRAAKLTVALYVTGSDGQVAVAGHSVTVSGGT
jgi:hypothetical protein